MTSSLSAKHSPLPPLLSLSRRPVVAVLGVRDGAQFRVGALDRCAVLAELGQDPRQLLLAAASAGQQRPVVAADAVGDRVKRLAVVVAPFGLEYVGHDLAGSAGKSAESAGRSASQAATRSASSGSPSAIRSSIGAQASGTLRELTSARASSGRRSSSSRSRISFSLRPTSLATFAACRARR